MRLWAFIIALFLHSAFAFAVGVDGRLSHFGETLHFEMRGRDNWDYKVSKENAPGGQIVYRVQVPELTPASLAEIQKFQFVGLASIKAEAGPDQSQILKFTFKNSTVDHFDYLTDRPSRLIVDFFTPPAEKAQSGEKIRTLESAKSALKKNGLSQNKSAQNKGSSLPERQPANDRLAIAPQGPMDVALGVSPETELESSGPQAGQQNGIFDGADPDFSRFGIQDFEVKEEALIASRQKVYVDFPILHERPDELKMMQLRAPAYQIQPGTSDENKQARLLLTLRQNKRNSVFLKTVDWFFKKYPKTEYAEILKFMWADVLYEDWILSQKAEDLDVAVQKYEEALKEFPQSALVERTLLLIGYSQLERGDYLGAIQNFGSYNNRFPESTNRDLVKMAMAEAYSQLNRSEDAIKLYDDVIQTAKRSQDRIRASFLKPDVLFQKKRDAEAIDAYKKVIAQYPKESMDYPSAQFNMAAAQFRLGHHRQSLNDHLEFVKKFPTHSYSGYALTRVGELLEILGADPARVIGAYLETYFRYGSNPAAVVARLRLVSSRMKQMKTQELEKAVDEIMKLAKESQLPKMDQFATVMIADGYHDRGDFDKSTKLLVEFYQKDPTGSDTELLTRRIVRNIADQIHNEVEQGKFLKAMKTHQNYSNSWLRNHQRIDVQYDLGRAFEQAGAFDESEKLYRESLNRILALKGTEAEKELGVFEKIPSKDELLLRLASVNMNRDQAQSAFENLKGIEHPEKLSEMQQIERIIMAAKLYDQKGDPQTAVRYLTELVKAWKGIPSLVAEPYFQLGQMEQKLGHKDAAIASYRRVDELMKDSGKINERTHFKALENMSRLQLETKQVEAAIGTLEKILDQYEQKFPVASMRYQLGKLHFDRGELQKADETWGKLDRNQSAFWANLADENLKSTKWNDDYKRYLKRIPAMAHDGKTQEAP